MELRIFVFKCEGYKELKSSFKFKEIEEKDFWRKGVVLGEIEYSEFFFVLFKIKILLSGKLMRFE